MERGCCAIADFWTTFLTLPEPLLILALMIAQMTLFLLLLLK